jgi:hypothetical protein
MKRTIVLLLFVAIAGPLAYCQGGARPQFFVGGGPSIPSAPEVFSRYWKMGYDVGGGIGFGVGRFVILQATADYISHPLDDDKILADAGATGLGLEVDGGNANMLKLFVSRAIPKAPWP